MRRMRSAALLRYSHLAYRVRSITSAKLAAQIPGSVLVNSLEEAAEWVKQNAREGDLVITLGCGDIYKASKMMVADNQ